MPGIFVASSLKVDKVRHPWAVIVIWRNVAIAEIAGQTQFCD
jgi:hypothetical protein